MEHSQNSLTSERPNEGIRTPLQGNTTPKKHYIQRDDALYLRVTLSFLRWALPHSLCYILFSQYYLCCQRILIFPLQLQAYHYH